MLKLYIYGYLNRVRSSRRLEAETHRNLEVIWLMRQFKPDFKTIADFRKINRSGFREVFAPHQNLLSFDRLCNEIRSIPQTSALTVGSCDICNLRMRSMQNEYSYGVCRLLSVSDCTIDRHA